MKGRVRATALACLGLGFGGAVSVVADAGVARRVRELAPDDGISQSVWVLQGIEWGSEAFLDLERTPVGREPWISDGTPAGTRLLADLVPGERGCDPQGLAEVGGRMYFAADVPGLGRELWVTDGTPSGTIPLGDLHAGPIGSDPMALGAVGELFFFSASDPSAGRELWRTDGTPAGTWRIADLRPGADGALDCGEWSCPEAGATSDLLLFGADDGVRGRELWRTDGTEEGTALVYMFGHGTSGGEPSEFFAATTGLYFRARTAAAGEELWLSDGTAGGTRLVRDLMPGPESSEPRPFGELGGRLLFAADDGSVGRELWSTDGTPAGTHPVRDIATGPASSDPRPGALLDGRLVFAANDGVHGSEPWVSDGTEPGTLLLRDLTPDDWGSTWFDQVARAGDRLYFDVSSGSELRVGVTDGTAEGTSAGVVVDDDYAWMSGLVGGSERAIVGLCSDSCGPCQQVCWTLSTDATDAGTERLLEFQSFQGSFPSDFSARSDDALFLAQYRLYATDGSEAGTDLLRTSNGEEVLAGAPLAPLPDGEYAFPGWSGEGGGGYELWRSFPEEAALLLDILPTWESGHFGPSRRVGELVYFAGAGGPTGAGLWTTDGTLPGTGFVAPFADEYGQSPGSIVDGFGVAWLVGSTSGHGFEPWESRGTQATTILHEVVPGPEPEYPLITDLTPFEPSDHAVLFRLELEIYRASASPEPPVLLHVLTPYGYPYWESFPIGVIGSSGLFFDSDPDGSCSLWRTDGTPAGTSALVSVGGGHRFSGSCPEELVTLGSRAYFGSCTPEHGCELWRTDGTAAGTARVTDREPGPLSFSPTALAAIAGRLYFSGCTTGRGCEPWISDGTAAGTHPVGDANPALASSNPHGFAPAQRNVYFAADDGTGEEPWVMPQEIFYDGFESGGLERWSGSGE